MRFLLGGLMLAFVLAASETRAQEQPPAVDDGPRSLAELAPAAIPDAENAAAQLEALAPLVGGWNAEAAQFLTTPAGAALENALDGDQPLTEEQKAVLEEILDRHAELAEGLQKAAMCTQFASRGDFHGSPQAFMDGLLLRIQRMRGVASFVNFEVRALTLLGRRDEAVRRGVDLLRLARLNQNEPTMISFLVTIAVRGIATDVVYRALANGNVSFDVQSTLEAELKLSDDPSRFTAMLRSERAYGLSTTRLATIGFGPLEKAGGQDLSGYIDAVIAASEEPWDDFRKQFRPGGKLAAPTGHGALADGLVPGLAASVTAWGRSLATMRSLRAYNLFKLHAKLKKREAAGLKDLELSDEAIADPFTGKPLVAKLTDDGWMVYSVGEDGRDDGGMFPADFGVGLKEKAER
jgi:hypothetical protein